MKKSVVFSIHIIFWVKDYLQIHTVDRKIMTLQTFKNLLESLPPVDFQRVHNSYVVSVSKIEHIERCRIRIGKELIPISESYNELVLQGIENENFIGVALFVEQNFEKLLILLCNFVYLL
jgi:DNA-binding LytR/AlgR family response regulator